MGARVSVNSSCKPSVEKSLVGTTTVKVAAVDALGGSTGRVTGAGVTILRTSSSVSVWHWITSGRVRWSSKPTSRKVRNRSKIHGPFEPIENNIFFECFWSVGNDGFRDHSKLVSGHSNDHEKHVEGEQHLRWEFSCRWNCWFLGAQLSRSPRCDPKVPRFGTNPHLEKKPIGLENWNLMETPPVTASSREYMDLPTSGRDWGIRHQNDTKDQVGWVTM